MNWEGKNKVSFFTDVLDPIRNYNKVAGYKGDI